MAYRSNERSMPIGSAGGRGSGRSSDSSMEDRIRGGGEENIRGIDEDDRDAEYEDTEDLEEEEEDEGSL